MEMSESRSIRKTLWAGTIPCRIQLDPGECRVFDASDPYYLAIPRMSYLPLFIPQIYNFFSPFLIDPETSKPESAWFEFESVPLKWHWPVGLLYDLFTGRDPAAAAAATGGDEDEHRLPWTLILRFRDFPVKHLMRLDSIQTCHDAWMNCVKEADHLRNGNAKTVMGLSREDSKNLWESLVSHDYDKFWSVNEKLIISQSSSSSSNIRYVPVRLYIPSAPRVIQQPIPPYQSSKQPHTVGTAMNLLLPELFPSQRVAVLARPVVHGVVIAMNTPLLELMREAVYPDGFLHISLAMMS